LLNGKCEAHFLKKKNPRKFHWTVFFRRLHKKGAAEGAAKKRRTRVVKASRPIAGSTWEQIVAKREQPESVRKAVREASLKKKQERDEKKKKEVKANLSAQRQQSNRQKPVKSAPSMKPKATSR